ncbi:MAG: type I pullulanase [Defluviitaleaceae bacterium]|nr:type I pullulanase [Defluviitaleaceae bacterium]
MTTSNHVTQPYPYKAYLDEYNEITLLVDTHIQDVTDAPFFLIDLMTGEEIELIVKEVIELGQYIKYRLLICEFIKLLHAFDVVDGKGVKSPLRLGGITRTKWFDQRFYDATVKLGISYEKKQTQFRIWSPTAVAVSVVLYQDDHPHFYEMTRTTNGVWERLITQNLEGVRYRYDINHRHISKEVIDPYGIASTENGTHSVVVDLEKTVQIDPALRPELKQMTDAIIYEVSIRDFTIHSKIAKEKRGKYVGLLELDYLKELGVTHIQLLPIYDFEGVDELHPDAAYNWGYNPSQYNVPEGSYATDPTDPYKRINELKTLINALHQAGFRVIMDVVYNHVYNRQTFPFEAQVSTYFYRYDLHGRATNGSGCGNDIASERAMVRKFMLDSVKFWLTEYGMDGFRFDLMGLLDIKTMNEIRKLCDTIDPTIMLYGEGWELDTALETHQKATLANMQFLPRIAHFNDTFRDVIKGSTFNHLEKGLALGNLTFLDLGKALLAGSSGRQLGESFKFLHPAQTINYVECHDNHTFWDRANMSNAQESDETRRKRQLLATAMVIFAQGIPFLHAGQEFFRTKKGVENSYQDSDDINAMDWERAATYQKEIDLVKGYLKIRKAHAAFRFPSSLLVKKHVSLSDHQQSVMIYELNDVKKFGDYSHIKVLFNLKEEWMTYPTELADFHMIANEEQSGLNTLHAFINETELALPPLSTTILVKLK